LTTVGPTPFTANRIFLSRKENDTDDSLLGCEPNSTS
jgi:hypothetical protein